jgi:homocitrate synthase
MLPSCKQPEYIKKKYNLAALREVENLVAQSVGIQVPFNNVSLQEKLHLASVFFSNGIFWFLLFIVYQHITGFCAFTHKAGIHAKAILANPSNYEILKPEDFGMTRYVPIGHRLVGWNSVKSRAEQLGLQLTDEQVKVRSFG